MWHCVVMGCPISRQKVLALLKSKIFEDQRLTYSSSENVYEKIQHKMEKEENSCFACPKTIIL